MNPEEREQLLAQETLILQVTELIAIRMGRANERG